MEPISLGDRRELLASWEEKWRAGGDSYMAMAHGDEIVGGIGLHWHGHEDRVEIGYWVRTGSTGKGYATEAAEMLTTAALVVPRVDVVAIHHDLANDASRRIPERLGYRLARQIDRDVDAPGQIGIELQWEMTRQRWSELGN